MLRRRKCAAISPGIEISATRPPAKHFYPRKKSVTSAHDPTQSASSNLASKSGKQECRKRRKHSRGRVPRFTQGLSFIMSAGSTEQPPLLRVFVHRHFLQNTFPIFMV